MKVNITNYPQIIEKYKNGLTLSDIAKEYSCTYVTIRKILKKNNIEIRPYNQFCDITGQRFFRFIVIEFLGRRNNGNSLWLCKCDCGRETQNDLSTLKEGKAKSCGKCQWRGDMPQEFWTQLIKSAEKRNYEFNLTKDYIWSLFEQQNGICKLSGLPVGFGNRSIKTNKKRTTTASLDRIDNNKGYIIGNVQWVHKDINKMRREFTIEYYKEMCQAVANYKE